ncbi:hypothetical protein [Chryseobacterium indologenes]|uniref:hypothetical protein n=1 Tax=Chryseobacterium indologenes TaxID=253 RepID=UPI0016281140|nr:hypothetical protein [Chryseobacterium indologenes]
MKKLSLFTFFAFLFAAIIYSCNSDSFNSISGDDTAKISNENSKTLARTSEETDGFSYINSKDPAFDNFLSSQTYQNHKDYINGLGQMDLNSILYKQYEVDGKVYDFFVVSLSRNGKLEGKLEILDLKETPFLPNKDKYALNYADLSSYDMDRQTGSIKLYDLNYENFMHTKMDIDKGYYTNVEGDGLSDELREKYAYLANPAKSANLTSRHLCDSNGNGNISFGECYSCIVRAIKQNSTSTAICHSYEAMGLPWWGSCGASVTVSCAIISSIS